MILMLRVDYNPKKQGVAQDKKINSVGIMDLTSRRQIKVLENLENLLRRNLTVI
jgi:hypothetical protein